VQGNRSRDGTPVGEPLILAISAREASTIHIVEVRRQRSTITPDTGPSSSQPAPATASLSDTMRGSRVIDAASSGRAPKVMPSPMNDTEAAIQTVQYGRPSEAEPRLMRR
jgi:hypothetical protein